MSFSRTRRAPIGGDPNANFHHNYQRYSTSTSTSTSSKDDFFSHQSRKQNRDRSFVDLDEGSAAPPPLKRRRSDAASRFAEDEEESRKRHYRNPPASTASVHHQNHNKEHVEEESASASASASSSSSFMSRDEIDRYSPSRKDGIDLLLETHLRYSYCSYLQSLGMRLQLPQTTIGTAMVLCHRFFLRRSHASNDRFLIATAALFLATKSEETPCLLNSVLRTSCEVCQTQNFDFFPYLVHSPDWFEQYRERVIGAEQMILTTLDFELDVHHPYVPLTSVLSKLGLSQTVLLNLAWNLVSEGISSRIMCSPLTFVIFLAGGLIHSSWEAYYIHLKFEQLARFGCNHMKLIMHLF